MGVGLALAFRERRGAAALLVPQLLELALQIEEQADQILAAEGVEVRQRYKAVLSTFVCICQVRIGVFAAKPSPRARPLHSRAANQLHTMFRASRRTVVGTSVYTNGTPGEAYRGAGRPEATFMVERLVDVLAKKLGMDPVEVRRRNFIPAFDDGHDVVTGLTYDSGNYQAALDKLLEKSGYSELRKEQAETRKQGQYIGLGLSTYVEICGRGPSQVAGASSFQRGLRESAIIRFHPSGKVHVFIGASPSTKM